MSVIFHKSRYMQNIIPAPRRPDTRAVHAGRDDLAAQGVHALPIDLSTTYPFPDLDLATASYDSLAGGGAPVGSAVYARLHNPTVARFEAALAGLEGTEGAVAFASGMAALTAMLLAARRDGGHVVAVRPVYGGTDHLLASGLLGMRVTFTRPEGVAGAVTPDTALVILETPANPTLELVDIAAVVAAAGAAPVVVDSTFATPVLQQPARHGAALVVHSATKFLGGHGDVIAGVVAGPAAWMTRLRQVRAMTGALLHPLAAYLLHRGLQTLPVRVRAQQANASAIAMRLLGHPRIAEVFHPSLPDGDPSGLLGRQQSGPGGVLSFRVRGGQAAARRMLGALRLVTPALSLGTTDSLIQYPAGLTHRPLSAEARAEGGIPDDLLRLSVGLEDPRDVLDDLFQALDAVGRPTEKAAGSPQRRMAPMA